MEDVLLKNQCTNKETYRYLPFRKEKKWKKRQKCGKMKKTPAGFEPGSAARHFTALRTDAKHLAQISSFNYSEPGCRGRLKNETYNV